MTIARQDERQPQQGAALLLDELLERHPVPSVIELHPDRRIEPHRPLHRATHRFRPSARRRQVELGRRHVTTNRRTRGDAFAR